MSIRTLTPELEQQARNELNEDSTKIKDYLQQIREWIMTQPHLNARMDDQWLLVFLRGCKYNLEKTKHKMEVFYTLKTLAPELFANRDPFLPELQQLLELGICIPLPKTLNKQPVLLLRFKDVNTETIHIMDTIKVVLMSLDIMLNEHDNFIINGNKVLEDLEHISLTHMLQMTPGNAKKIFTCFQEAYPIRFKRAYFINAPGFFAYLYALLKPFMSKKLKDRIKLKSENEMEDVYADIPRSVLPIEYGGEDGSIKDMAADWKRKVESYRDWFLDDAKYCSDESKRSKEASWSLWKKLFGN